MDDDNWSMASGAQSPVILLRRVVPPAVLYALVCIVSLANTALIVLMVGKKILQNPLALWELAVIFIMAPAVVAAWELHRWFVERSKRRDGDFICMCTHNDGLLAVCMAIAMAVNAKLYQAHFKDPKGDCGNLCFVWPLAEMCPYFVYITGACLLAQHLYVPKEEPQWRSWRYWLALLAFYFAFGVTIFFVCYSNSGTNLHAQSWKSCGFMADNGNIWLPPQVLLLVEAARFLHTGNWQGVPIFFMIQAGSWLVGNFLWFGLQPYYPKNIDLHKDAGSFLNYLTIVQMCLLGLAIQSRPRLDVPSSWRARQSRLLGNQSRDLPGWVTHLTGNFTDSERINGRLGTGYRAYRAFSDSFVGQSWIFLLNGLYSFLLYRISEKTLAKELKANRVGHTIDPSYTLTITWVLSLVSVFVAAYNVATGTPRLQHLTYYFLPYIPADSQFRLLTFLKAEMLWLKVTILGWTNYDTVHASQGGTHLRVLCQFLAVVFSVAVSTMSAFTAFRTSRAAVSANAYQLRYRHGTLLLISVLVSALCIQALIAVAIFGKLTGIIWASNATFVKAVQQADPTLWVGFAQYYTVPFICFLNEMICQVRGLGLVLWFVDGSYTVDCPTGVRVFATYLTAFPGALYAAFILGPLTNNDAVENLFLGKAGDGQHVGIPRYEGTWAAPCVTYLTLALMVIGVVAHFASAEPLSDDSRASTRQNSLSVVAPSEPAGAILDPTTRAEESGKEIMTLCASGGGSNAG